MDYFRELFPRAWSDTWNVVFNSPPVSLVAAILIFGLSTLMHWYRTGFSDMKDVFMVAVEGALATLIVFAFIFALFFFLLAPRQLYYLAKSPLPEIFLGTSSVQMVFPGGSESPQPVPNTNVNVYRWTALRYNALLQEQGTTNTPTVAGVIWTIYIVFDKPIATEVNFFSTTNVHPKPDIELRDISTRSAIVIIGAEMPAGLIELQFRTAKHTTQPSAPTPDKAASPH